MENITIKRSRQSNINKTNVSTAQVTLNHSHREADSACLAWLTSVSVCVRVCVCLCVICSSSFWPISPGSPYTLHLISAHVCEMTSGFPALLTVRPTRLVYFSSDLPSYPTWLLHLDHPCCPAWLGLLVCPEWLLYSLGFGYWRRKVGKWSKDKRNVTGNTFSCEYSFASLNWYSTAALQPNHPVCKEGLLWLVDGFRSHDMNRDSHLLWTENAMSTTYRGSGGT